MAWTGPVLMGEAREELAAIAVEGEPIVPANMAEASSWLERMLLLPRQVLRDEAEVKGWRKVIPDGNRGAYVPDLRIELDGREFVIGIKGIGARHPMFGEGHLSTIGGTKVGGRAFTSEDWFGENPWGAMSEQACQEDAQVTELMGPDGIDGFLICPMLRAEPLPDWLMERARATYWYRRLDRPGPYYQQLRLMPSDVRLFYQSEFTLGIRAREVLDAFSVDTVEDLDAFIDRYIGSGLAALTLIARTAEPHDDWGHRALDYDDVWLDKDSVIAPDGAIHFADIEGLAWVPLRDDHEAEHRMVRQFNRNYYEFMYGLDCLLDERDREAGRRQSRAARRLELAVRLELALEGDGRLELERDGRCLHLNVLPRTEGLQGVKIKLMDLDGGNK